MLIARHRQQGVTLIEAMIALLVISIGLLGIAALQITAMSQNTSSLNHSQAVWIAYNMSDRIRANTTEFNTYIGIDTNNSYNQDCMSGACTTGMMVTADATDWGNLIAALPAGRGIIANDPDGLSITVMWDDDGTGATGTGCGNDTSVDLTCYSLVVAP